MDPSMKQIFSWGYEAPVKQDYAKDKASISNKIRKMQRAYISESHDNFRKPESADGDQLLFNYFDTEQIELFKKKFYNLALEKENQDNKQSAYKAHFSKEKFAQVLADLQ